MIPDQWRLRVASAADAGLFHWRTVIMRVAGYASGIGLLSMALSAGVLEAQDDIQGRCGRVVPALIQDSSAAGVAMPDSALRAVPDVSALSGRRIAWVNVVTVAPDRLPGVAGILGGLHARTRPDVVRRELLFAAGDTVDPVRIAESLRRLRHMRYLADVQLAACSANTTTCTGADTGDAQLHCIAPLSIGLTVTTRDAWSAQPTLRLGTGSAGSVVGFQERNLMGTARVAKVYLRSDNGRVGAGAGFVDPWLLGHDIIGSLSRDVFRDGGAWRASARTHQRSVFDPLVVEVAVGQSVRAPHSGSSAAIGDVVRRSTAHILFDRLLTGSQAGVTRVLFGAEGEQTGESVASTAPVLGPFDVHRSFAGLDFGLARRTARYELNTWLLPSSGGRNRAIADIPSGAEGEVVTALGRDFLTGGMAVRYDGWGGRMWSLGSRSLVTADAWASGFHTGADWSATSVRGALGVYRAGKRGLWIGHVAAEELTDPDPTVRALSTFDPTIPSLPSRSSLAEAALAASVERTLHLRPVTGSYMLDVAGFGAGSLRWDPVSTVRDQLGVLAVGVGLRLSPLREGIATLRLDAGFPVVHSPGVASRPFLALSVSPWLGAGRERAGRGPLK